MTRGEFETLARIARRLASAPDGQVWVGDDAAVVGPMAGRVLFTVDIAVAGIHGDLELMGLDDFGWRALAGAVSDIAAMGGRVGHAVVAVAGPPATDLDLLYEGLTAASAAFGCPIVGGDLSGGDQVVVAVAVVGSTGPSDRAGPAPSGVGLHPAEPGPVLRSGARAGDSLFVTGPLGASAAGLRRLRDAGGTVAPAGGVAELVRAHRRPVARLGEGVAARLAGAHAMIDVSDGLAADLGHLADASGVGVVLDSVPVAPGATLDEALGGGEDYELVFAVPDPGAVTGAFADAGFRPPLAIGRCVADRAVRSLAGSPMPAVGWEHRFGPSA